jgi:SagB-type dehydrogenase family enzyme
VQHDLIDVTPTLLDDEGELWELYHVNSKTTRSDLFTSTDQMAAIMRQMPLTFAAASRNPIALPAPDPGLLMQRGLAETMLDRLTPMNFIAPEMSLAELATLAFACAGENRTAADAGAERAFRVVPSGGALYALELYLHCRTVAGLDCGIYHYDPTQHALRLHVPGDQTDAIAGVLVQPNLPFDTSVQLIFSMIPSRLTVKYGNRGYRFALLEAGHAAQNALLAARGMCLDAVPVGGYRDEEFEALLGLDGVNHTVGYLTFVGKDQDA